MKRFMLAALVGVLVSGPAWGEEKITLGDMIAAYDRLPKGNKVKAKLERQVGLMGRGMLWANGYTNEAWGSKLFCPPNKHVFTDNLYFSIARTKILSTPKYQEMQRSSAGYALIMGLRETFPCKK